MKTAGRQSLLAQIMKFAVVGGLSFIIDFAIYTAILLVFKGRVAPEHEKALALVAAFFGFTISLIFNYISSMRFVFTHDENMDRRREFIIFAVLSIIGLVLNEVIILGVLAVYDNVGFLQNGFLWDIKEWVGKIFATGIVMVYNFITRKIFIEKKE